MNYTVASKQQHAVELPLDKAGAEGASISLWKVSVAGCGAVYVRICVRVSTACVKRIAVSSLPAPWVPVLAPIILIKVNQSDADANKSSI